MGKRACQQDSSHPLTELMPEATLLFRRFRCNTSRFRDQGVAAIEELVKGVTLRRAGSSLEEVQLRSSAKMQLLASWDGTEVVRQVIPQGRRFGMRPQEGWTALECYYILSGQAVWEAGDKEVCLGPGDTIAAAPVGEPFMLRAITDLELLYVCSQPGFHLVSDYASNLRNLAVSVEEKDGYTRDHCRRIRDLSMAVGTRLGLNPLQQYHLYHGSFLHDLGKVGVPDQILRKPGALTAAEWEIMKQHPTIGGQMLSATLFAGSAFILEQHHERIDGSGYPLGLTGDQISVEAQIVAVVDSFDAMTTDRVYRPGMPKEVAVRELESLAGRLFSTNIVEAFKEIVDNP